MSNEDRVDSVSPELFHEVEKEVLTLNKEQDIKVSFERVQTFGGGSDRSDMLKTCIA